MGRQITIQGSKDNDTINAFNGQDLVSGEGGDDFINCGDGNDTLFGDVGIGTAPSTDSTPLNLNINNVVSQTYAGNSASAGNSAVYSNVAQRADGTQISGRLILVSKSDPNMTVDLTGRAGFEILLNQQGSSFSAFGTSSDTSLGGQGQDTLVGGLGSDSLNGGTGDDFLEGGDGTGILTSGIGNDNLKGGMGSDTFNFDGVGGHTIVGGEGVDGLDIDVLDLTGFGGTGSSVAKTGPESGFVEFFDANGNVSSVVNYSEIEQVVICFTLGTRLATVRGEVSVESLREEDRVFTRDNGIQTLAWAGTRDLSGQELADHPEFNPVHIRKGALGNNVAERDMAVSPDHRMLITSSIADVLFGEREVLVAEKHLISLDGINQIVTRSIQYIHLMFEQHEIVLADGAWTESFQPGDHSLKGIGSAQRGEIIALFPELETVAGMGNYGAARRSLTKHEAAYLSRRLG
tara:strand:- start:4918 stop:6303 length:1386 start_codon:yes stop_codon:yes gene_type:complete